MWTRPAGVATSSCAWRHLASQTLYDAGCVSVPVCFSLCLSSLVVCVLCFCAASVFPGRELSVLCCSVVCFVLCSALLCAVRTYLLCDVLCVCAVCVVCFVVCSVGVLCACVPASCCALSCSVLCSVLCSPLCSVLCSALRHRASRPPWWLGE
jgi:hypothetical protein